MTKTNYIVANHAVSNNGMPGVWTHATIDNLHFGKYNFKTTAPLCDKTFTFVVTVIDPNTDPVVANPDVISQHFALVASTTTDSILNNDTFAGVVITPSVSGLIINLFDAPPGVTANIDGTLNIPPDLPVRQYIIKYQVKTDCGQADAVVTLNITDDSGVVFDRIIKIGYCYTTTGFISNESVFDGTLINGIRADSTNATVSNLQPVVAGVSINANGNFVFAPHTVPFDYYFTCVVCPTGSSVGCATYTIARFVIEKSVFANSDEIGGRADGTFRWFNTNSILPPGVNWVNILDNDVYGIDCGIAGPTDDIDLGAGGNANFNNLDVAFTTPAGTYFEVLPNGDLRKKPGYLFPIQDGVYYFNYRICDNQNPPICSSTTDGPFDRRCRIIINNTGFARQAENSLISNEIDNTLSISPNPSNGIFNLNFKDLIKDEVLINIYNQLGQLLFTDTIVNSNDYVLNTNNFSDGHYLVKVTIGEITKSFKIIKKQ